MQLLKFETITHGCVGMAHNYKLRTMWKQTCGAYLYGINKKTQRKNPNLEIMFYGFPKEKRHTWANSGKVGLLHLGYSIAYPIILLFLFLLTILNQI
jgi:hypothetical protein